MSEARRLDALCPTCDDVQVHTMGEDPGSCLCTVCGNVQTMFVPVA